MSQYHCPTCNGTLRKGPAPFLVRMFVGPLFGLLLRPLSCVEHGEIAPEMLGPEERSMVKSRRAIGMGVGIALNVAVLLALLVAYGSH